MDDVVGYAPETLMAAVGAVQAGALAVTRRLVPPRPLLLPLAGTLPLLPLLLGGACGALTELVCAALLAPSWPARSRGWRLQ